MEQAKTSKKKIIIIIVVAIILLTAAGLLSWKYIFSKEARLTRLRHKLSLSTTDTERDDIQKKMDELIATEPAPPSGGGGGKGGSGGGGGGTGGKGGGILDEVQKNLGGGAFTAQKDALVSVAGGGKYKAYFYTNGRIIFIDGSGSRVMAGSFSNGGKKIVIDSADGGYVAESGSVYSNLESVTSHIK